jgi:hypothetical protein
LVGLIGLMKCDLLLEIVVVEWLSTPMRKESESKWE